MSERKSLSGLEDVVIKTPKASAAARKQFQENRIARQSRKRDVYVAAAKVTKARKIQDGPSSSYGVQSVPSVKAHLNRAAIKGSFGEKRLVSEVRVNKMGEASFLSMNTETKEIKKITFERTGAMVVDSGDQPRDEYGRWM
jgi:hypothetical protein